MSQIHFNSDINFASGLDKEAKEASVKFSSDEWKAAERKLGPFDLKVQNELCELANNLVGINNSTKIDESIFKAMGDEFYKLIRSDLVKEKLVQQEMEQKKKIKEKPKKAIDKIRQENTIRMIEAEITKVIKGFDLTDFRIPSGLCSKILEARAIGFMQNGLFLLHNKKVYLDSNNIIRRNKIRFVYSILIAMEKFLTAVKGMDGTSILNPSQRNQISEKLIEDYLILLDEVKKMYSFDGIIAYNNAPELLFYTDYDSYIPSKGFKPYPHQKEITEGIKNALINKKPTIFSYKAMTGNGKTVSVVAIAKMIENLKMMYPAYASTELLFCCNLRSVKEQAAQWLFNSNISFGLGVIDGDRGLRIINNYNCKSDEKRVAIVCSPEACYEIMKDDIYKNYVLFIDEPTIGADMKTSAAKMNVRLMSNLPAVTVLSSATLPHEVYPWIKENHIIRHGDSDFITIYSNKIHIGCEVKTFEGALVVPHLHSKNSDDLIQAIKRIAEIPFLGRAYTINVVRNMYNLMSSESIPNIPDISERFRKTENLNTDSVRELAMNLLRILSTQPVEVIQKICSSTISSDTIKTIEKISTRSDEGDDDFEWEEEPIQEVTSYVDFEKFGTSDAHRFMWQNLVATLNPVEFAYKKFKNLIDDVLKEIGSLRKLNQLLSQETEIWQKQVDRLDKQEFVNELERLKETDVLFTSKPQFKFPNKFQINTKEHIRHYAKKTNLAINKSSIRIEINPSDIPIDTITVQDELMILLLCGVGVYTPSFNLNPVYLATVLRLAEEGKLAYLISDASISYGTNYPINRVFITADFSEKYSINTIFQLMSRAGRVGKSWIAEAYIDNACAMRIINTTTSNEEDIETKNINELYKDIIIENIAHDQKLIEELEMKKRQEEEKIRKAEQEKIRKAEEEKIRKAQQEKLAREEAERRRRDNSNRLQGFSSLRRVSNFTKVTNGNNVTNSNNVTNVSSVMTEPPSRVSMENRFSREATGQVSRRNTGTTGTTTMSRTQRIQNSTK
jgi:hypothetical protein